MNRYPMTEVDLDTYLSIQKWVEGANNYAGVGQHEVSGTTDYLQLNGVQVAACYADHEDGTHHINSALLKKYKEDFGYIIKF